MLAFAAASDYVSASPEHSRPIDSARCAHHCSRSTASIQILASPFVSYHCLDDLVAQAVVDGSRYNLSFCRQRQVGLQRTSQFRPDGQLWCRSCAEAVDASLSDLMRPE